MWSSQHGHERQIRRPKTTRALAPKRQVFRPRLEGLEDRTGRGTGMHSGIRLGRLCGSRPNRPVARRGRAGTGVCRATVRKIVN